MTRFGGYIVAAALVVGTGADASEATLAKAVTAYNNLPSKTYEIAIEADRPPTSRQVVALPIWLAKADLDDKEAAATAAAFGVYGNAFDVNYRSRKWNNKEKAAAWVAETLATWSNPNQAPMLPDAGATGTPSLGLTEGRRAALLSTMSKLGTCSGALMRAVQKTSKLRASDDASRLLAKAQRDLGAAALPPDDSCLV